MSDLEKKMQNICTDWLNAAATKDADWYRNNMADEFRYLKADGGVLDRDGIIHSAKTGDNEYILRSVDGVRSYGDVVTCYGSYFARGKFQDDNPSSADMREKYALGVELRFSGTLIERDGRLQFIYIQTTPITEK